MASRSPYSGHDFIDAVDLFADLPSNALPTIGVTLYGGAGNDTFVGSQTGDIIAGGSGDDLVLGERGEDLIVGDDGVNVDLLAGTASLVAVPLVTVLAVPPPNADPLLAGPRRPHRRGPRLRTELGDEPRRRRRRHHRRPRR